MDWSSQEPEILREVASVGGYYGRKIEKCLSRKRRLKRALGYLSLRMGRYGLPVFTMRMMVRLRKDLERTQRKLDEYVYYMIVHREAIGLTSHKTLYEVYNLYDD